MGLEELDVNQDAARHQPRCGWDRLGRVTVASGGVDHNVGHGHGSQRLEELMSWGRTAAGSKITVETEETTAGSERKLQCRNQIESIERRRSLAKVVVVHLCFVPPLCGRAKDERNKEN
ncbi:hypothetical protein WN943_017952 [Citrus x changshan-huyou]